MEKQTRRFDIRYNADWDGATIERVKNDLIEIEEKGATHIEFDVNEDFCEVRAYAVRIETDEEYESRVKSKAEYEERLKQREIENYTAIKAKYNLQ